MAQQPESDDETTMRPSDDVACYCQVDGVMELLSRKYAMQLICVIGATGPIRYGEIESTFGNVSSSTLSTRLEELVEAGVISREQYAEIPPRVEYELTAAGASLCEQVEPLLEWVDEHDEFHTGA